MTLSIDPRVFGSPMLTWPAVAAILCVAAVVAFMTIRARSVGASRPDMYAISVRAVLWGILGARLLHVVDYAGYYAEVPFQIAYIWNGGFSAWGAVLGALGGGLWHARRRGVPLGPFADLAVVPGLAGIALFRLVDFLTAQRPGSETSLPWGVVYGHPAGQAFSAGVPQHPVALYEMLLVLAVLAIALSLVRLSNGHTPSPVARWPSIGVLKPGALMVFAFGSYAAIRFVVGFVSDAAVHLGLRQDQWIALAVVAAIVVRAWLGHRRATRAAPAGALWRTGASERE